MSLEIQWYLQKFGDISINGLWKYVIEPGSDISLTNQNNSNKILTEQTNILVLASWR